MRVIVCGGRNYDDRKTMDRIMVALFADGPWTVVHGDARGADRMAGELANWYGLTVEAFPADWDALGKSAGPDRNRRMLAAGADLVLAFPGGWGTAHMVSIAREAGVPVLEVKP